MRILLFNIWSLILPCKKLSFSSFLTLWPLYLFWDFVALFLFSLFCLSKLFFITKIYKYVCLSILKRNFVSLTHPSNYWDIFFEMNIFFISIWNEFEKFSLKNFVEMCNRWSFYLFFFFSYRVCYTPEILKEVCDNCSLGWEEKENWKTETKRRGQSFLKFFDSYKIQTPSFKALNYSFPL